MNKQIKKDELLRVELQNMVMHKHGLGESWLISDSEFNDLISVAEKSCISMGKLIDCFSHIDSETGKVVAEGWLCFGGKYFFTNEASALKKVREYGFKSLNLASWANAKMGATYFKTPCR